MSIPEERHDNPDVQRLIDWFFAHYEDPAHSLPYDSGEGGYQWIYGPPHDAEEELGAAFPDEDPAVIEHAVCAIHDYGTEWVSLAEKQDANEEWSQGKEIFDAAARRNLGMSGDDFLVRYDAGEIPNPDRPEVMRVLMLRPFAGR